MQALNQIKQFTLLTVKSIVDLYKNIFVVTWPMWISMAVAAAVVGVAVYPFFGLQESIMSLLTVCGMFLFRASVILVRPSVEKKSVHSLARSTTFSTFTLPILMLSIGILLYKLLLQQPVFSTFFTSPLNIKTLLILPLHPLHLFTLTVFYTLFMLDTNRAVKQIVPSIIRATKMLIYNFPVYFILFVLFYYFITPIVLLVPNIYIRAMFLAFLCPIPISVLSNLYITWTHRNYSRYFG